MAIDATQTDLQKYTAQALRKFGPSPDGQNVLTDAVINPLTTVAGLIAAIVAAPKKTLEHDLNVNQAVYFVTKMKEYGVLTDANIASANTFAQLITNVKTGIATAEDEVLTTYYGDNGYFGEAYTIANVY